MNMPMTAMHKNTDREVGEEDCGTAPIQEVRTVRKRHDEQQRRNESHAQCDIFESFEVRDFVFFFFTIILSIQWSRLRWIFSYSIQPDRGFFFHGFPPFPYFEEGLPFGCIGSQQLVPACVFIWESVNWE
jgi:hypothetical protein